LVSVPMNVRQRRPETAYMIQHCEASALIYDVGCQSEVPDGDEACSLRVRFAVGGSPLPGDRRFDDLAASEGTAPRHQPDQEEPFCILYTSGTTGRPKGAVLTHLGCIHSVLHYQHGFALAEGEVGALVVPVSHVTGLVAILLLMVRLAGATIFVQAFRARAFLELVECERVTYTLMVPAMYKLCLLEPELTRFNLSSWRVGGFGGEPMPAATITELAAAIPTLALSNVYGATETSSPVTILPPGFPTEHRNSVGMTLPCAEILIADAEGREVPPGEHGELLIAGPMVIPGYWNNPVADSASFVGGFWRSGDIGSMDAAGRVYIYDRIKDVVNRGGYKVYCAEVENIIMQYPGVRECAVVGAVDNVLGVSIPGQCDHRFRLNVTGCSG